MGRSNFIITLVSRVNHIAEIDRNSPVNTVRASTMGMSATVDARGTLFGRKRLDIYHSNNDAWLKHETLWVQGNNYWPDRINPGVAYYEVGINGPDLRGPR